jgi:hypothetical protein
VFDVHLVLRLQIESHYTFLQLYESCKNIHMAKENPGTRSMYLDITGQLEFAGSEHPIESKSTYVGGVCGGAYSDFGADSAIPALGMVYLAVLSARVGATLEALLEIKMTVRCTFDDPMSMDTTQ